MEIGKPPSNVPLWLQNFPYSCLKMFHEMVKMAMPYSCKQECKRAKWHQGTALLSGPINQIRQLT